MNQKRRWLAWAALVCYVLASTTAGLWHDHAPSAACCSHDSQQADLAATAHAHAGHCHEHPAGAEPETEECSSPQAAPPAPHGAEDCEICRFLAMRLLSVPPATAEHVTGLVCQLPPDSPAPPQLSIASAYHSRAPPLA